MIILIAGATHMGKTVLAHANDVVLIVLWVLASVEDKRYVSVVVCFAAFLVNDIYGFYSWKRMEKRQSM